MNELLTSNEWQYRLLRTIAQGVVGVVIADLDLIVGFCLVDAPVRALVVALVMAVLSPIMATAASRSREAVACMGLNGIDISSWQEDLVVSNMTTCDFVIVKATGGKGYSNKCFKGHADATLAADKLLGCYHYARDRGYEGSTEEEADFFIAA